MVLVKEISTNVRVCQKISKIQKIPQDQLLSVKFAANQTDS